MEFYGDMRSIKELKTELADTAKSNDITVFPDNIKEMIDNNIFKLNDKLSKQQKKITSEVERCIPNKSNILMDSIYKQTLKIDHIQMQLDKVNDEISIEEKS